MADHEIAESGVFIDRDTGRVVRSRPRRGIQIVPPGGEVTPARRAALDVYETATADLSVETSDAETTDETCAGTTKSGEPCSKTATDGEFCHLHGGA